MSTATRKAKGSIFAVHCDLEDQPTTASTSSSSRAPKRKQSVLANKENSSSFSSSSSLSSVPTKKSTPFNGKVPFELASPVNTLSDQLTQTLGFFGPEATSNKLQHRRINSMKGDPTKGPAKGVSKSLKLVKGKEVFKVLATEEEQAPPSPVLANVTEAYNGNGGFHYSPITPKRDPSTCFEVPTPTGNVFVLPDKDVAVHQDDPSADTVVYSGSPIKKSRTTRPRVLGAKGRGLRL